MFKKSVIISLCTFFILMIFTSFIKNKTRGIEKNIQKLNKEISDLQKELDNSIIDFVYLSSPEKLEENLNSFGKKKYSSFDHSRFFLSTQEFQKHSSKKTLNLKSKNYNDQKNKR